MLNLHGSFYLCICLSGSLRTLMKFKKVFLNNNLKCCQEDFSLLRWRSLPNLIGAKKQKTRKMIWTSFRGTITLSWWSSLSHRNQSIWFLYDRDLRHKRVKQSPTRFQHNDAFHHIYEKFMKNHVSWLLLGTIIILY